MTTHEKLQNLVELAKAAGRYVEQGGQRESDYGKDAYARLKARYEAFCTWRHDEPDIVHVMTIDDLKTLIRRYDELFRTMWQDEEHHEERVQELEHIRETFATHGLVIGLGNSKTIVTLPDNTKEGIHG